MRWKRVVLVVLPAVLVAVALLAPLPYFVISPGEAVVVEDRVELFDEVDPVSGDLLLLTVRLARATPLRWAVAQFDRDSEVLEEDAVIPEGVDDEDFLEAQQRVFRESGRVAAAVGLRRAGKEVRISGKGAEVRGLVAGGPAEGALKRGDVVLAVDGRAVSLASDLISALATYSPGDTVTLRVDRGGPVIEVPVTLGRVEGIEGAALGVSIDTVDFSIVTNPDFEVEQGQIGGPSAGLMIALAVFDLASDADLTRSRKVAGTGTIDVEGRVGPVGGVRQKVKAARDAGATVMFTPGEEAAEAREAAGDDIEIVPVATFDEAVARLLDSRR